MHLAQELGENFTPRRVAGVTAATCIRVNFRPTATREPSSDSLAPPPFCFQTFPWAHRCKTPSLLRSVPSSFEVGHVAR